MHCVSALGGVRGSWQNLSAKLALRMVQLMENGRVYFTVVLFIKKRAYERFAVRVRSRACHAGRRRKKKSSIVFIIASVARLAGPE